VRTQALGEPEAYLAYRRTASPRFFFSPADRAVYAALFSRWDTPGPTPVQSSNKLAAGYVRYFSHTDVQVGCPPDWHVNPFTQQRLPVDRHWSQIADRGVGDIKVVWEPSRFSFAYQLVRAY
jgi:hypothetical protein